MSGVDVIIPCYRYAHFLQGCVESVLSQPVDVRVLIIDDCSPDNTPQVAAQLMAQDPRVDYRRHAVNHGHVPTYNEGLEWATRDYTLLLSADDMLVPNALLNAVTLMDANPEVGFVHGRSIRFQTDQPLPPARPAAPGAGWRIRSGLEYIEASCLDGGNLVSTPTAVVRTTLQHRLGGYRKELAHTGDMEMWLRFAAHAGVGYIDADQAYYRIHGNNMHIKELGTHLLDLRQRVAAFETLFREHGDRIPVDRLRSLSGRHIARSALWVAIRAFDERDTATYNAVLEMLDRDYPDYRVWPECAYLNQRLRWRQRVGPALYSELRRFAALWRRAGRARTAAAG